MGKFGNGMIGQCSTVAEVKSQNVKKNPGL